MQVKKFKTVVIIQSLLILFISQILSCKTVAEETNSIKIAVIDTGFCVSKIHSTDNLSIHNSFDATKSLNGNNCKLDIEHPRLHGHRVLQTFIKNLKSNKEIEIYPIVVFDKDGLQKISYWKNAYKKSRELKVDLILTASGFPHSERLEKYPVWEILTFAPSGRVEGNIFPNTKLYPQILATQKNLFIIGSYKFDKEIDIYFLDKQRLNKDKIDYYFQDHDSEYNLSGSSYSVTIAAAKALNICNIHDLRNCLAEKAKNVKLEAVNNSVKTY